MSDGGMLDHTMSAAGGGSTASEFVDVQKEGVPDTLIEQALDEIKEFIGILYNSCIRFYNTLVVY